MAEMAGNPGFPESGVTRHLGPFLASTRVRKSFRSAQEPFIILSFEMGVFATGFNLAVHANRGRLVVEMAGNPGFPDSRVSRHLGPSQANKHVRER